MKPVVPGVPYLFCGTCSIPVSVKNRDYLLIVVDKRSILRF